MNAGAAYDTLEQARKLKGVGFEDDLAETLALCMRDAVRSGRDDLATKTDIAELKAEIAELRSSMYRALWLQGAGIIAILAALRFFPSG